VEADRIRVSTKTNTHTFFDIYERDIENNKRKKFLKLFFFFLNKKKKKKKNTFKKNKKHISLVLY
jgi:hypothetical protein